MNNFENILWGIYGLLISIIALIMFVVATLRFIEQFKKK